MRNLRRRASSLPQADRISTSHNQMASLNPDSFMSSWLRLVDDPSKDVLSKITTTYTNAPKGNQTSCVDILTPLAMLHQCRLDVLSVTEGLRKAESWTALTDSQMQLSHLRLRFRKSTKEMGGAALKHFGRMRASDAPFGRVHWEKTGTRNIRDGRIGDADKLQEPAAQHLRPTLMGIRR